MLYIYHYSGIKDVRTEWKVGETYPIEVYAKNVFQVDADGEELEYIFERFEGLTRVVEKFNAGKDRGHRYVKSQKWFGDTAKFIVGNLT